jgi:hypothetical protein
MPRSIQQIRTYRPETVPLLPSAWLPFARRFPMLPETPSDYAPASGNSPGVIGGATADGEMAAGAIGAMAAGAMAGTIGGTIGERPSV